MSAVFSTAYPLPASQTIPEAIGLNIESNSSHPYFTFADPATLSGVRIITHLNFGEGAHRVAHVVTRSFGLGWRNRRHSGFPFPISPRNSPAAIVNLLTKTICRRILATPGTLKYLLDQVQCQYRALSALDFEIMEIPSLYTVYPHLRTDGESPPNLFSPYPVSRPDYMCMFLHSSGSSGLPKAIPQTHRALMNWASFPAVTDFRDTGSLISCAVLPTFHAFGVYTQLLMPIYGLISMSVYPPSATGPDRLLMVASPSNVLEQVQRTRSKILVVVPSLLQVWASNEEVIKFLASLERVVYAGGTLAPKIGVQLVDAGVNLAIAYGATEFGAPTHIAQGNGVGKEWEYVLFSDLTKIRWVDQGDGTFECQVLACETHRPMVFNLTDVEGYATSDLWVPHPTKKNLWKIVGRMDDVIIHSSGEKTVPGPMENVILGSPLPVVEEANGVAPAFSRIFKDMIVLTSKEKPLPRSGKGTILRKAALALYKDEIDTL
ncbi:hypothetical protein H0H92_006932 [Tricholoma furcatifolium]|nr:hypothetical protein H0H92_006932 [Tricholoma furcatifolium]